VAQRKYEDQTDTYTLKYLLQDYLGSTTGTASDSGVSTSTIKYFSFGATRSTTGALPTDKKFTGQRLDTTCLYYYGARYYDATIGRFISPNTIVPSLYNPQSLNRYSYCLNNPLRFIDPSGYTPLDDYIAWIGTGGNTPPPPSIDGIDKTRPGNGSGGPIEPDLPVDDNPVVPEEPKPSIPEPFIGSPAPEDDDDLGEIIRDLFATAGITIILVADDATGVGVVDDAAIAVAWGAFKAEHFKTSDAHAPGKPTEKDGYYPPKHYNGEKVKYPKGPGYGYLDKDGNVWVPTGSNGHGGPHWDVEFPGGGYRNVYPWK
jgi:RHS repeat-associated protein